MNIFTSIEYIHIAMCFVYGRLVKSVFPMIVFRLEDVILDVLWYVYIWTYNYYVINKHLLFNYPVCMQCKRVK